MKQIAMVFTAILGLLLYGCNDGRSQTSGNNLDPQAFSKKIAQTNGAVLLDVRTPEEYAEGHLDKALNYNWKGSEFQQQIAVLDKAKPVFVYCRSGARSGAAAASMREQGFTQVYELNGGIIKWRSAGLPETKEP